MTDPISTADRRVELLPCPFCGSTNVDPEGWASTERSGPACDDCAGTADTVELWNTRPLLAASPASDEMREVIARCLTEQPAFGFNDQNRLQGADVILGYLRDAGCLSSPASGGEWRTIDSAPKDGTCVLLLSKEYTDPADVNGGPYHHPAKCAIGRWCAEGDSWCDEHGRFADDLAVEDDSITLRVTGTWHSGGGWFQPNEVTHWQPLPAPPGSPSPAAQAGEAE